MKRTPTILLNGKAKRFVKAKLASGRYDSANQVVEEALNLLEIVDRQHEAQLQLIDAGIDQGLADARAGRMYDFDEAAVERIKRRGRALLAQRRRKSA